MTQTFSFAGRIALVTGGASGIGLGIVTALLARGAVVLVADVRDDHMDKARSLLAHHGERLLLQRLDVSRPEDWRLARENVAARFGGLDVLCLNAGIGVLGGLTQASVHDWKWLLGVNLEGVTLGVQSFLPMLRQRPDGSRLYATSSIGGLMASHNDGLYACAKFGVTALMEGLREDLAKDGVGVTTLFPAAVNTNIHDHATMRPSDLADSGLVLGEPEQRAGMAMAMAILAQGADPLQVGEQVVDALAAKQPYVFTDALVAPRLRLRRDALLAAASA